MKSSLSHTTTANSIAADAIALATAVQTPATAPEPLLLAVVPPVAVSALPPAVSFVAVAFAFVELWPTVEASEGM